LIAKRSPRDLFPGSIFPGALTATLWHVSSTPWVYIMASRPRGTIYIGMTDDLRRRAREHRGSRGSAFTRKYGVKRLVWFAYFDNVAMAQQRERTMKEWPRAWKINVVERENPNWNDLWNAIDNKSADARPRGQAPGLQFGKVEIPQEAFIAALKMDES
jgi:putative endonuclease